MAGFIDLAGKRFGRLIVLDAHKRIDNRTKWLCLCRCLNPFDAETKTYYSNIAVGG